MKYVSIHLEDVNKDFILNEKTFKTGSKGFHAMGNMVVGDKRYQVNVLCVEIGSKTKQK